MIQRRECYSWVRVEGRFALIDCHHPDERTIKLLDRLESWDGPLSGTMEYQGETWEGWDWVGPDLGDTPPMGWFVDGANAAFYAMQGHDPSGKAVGFRPPPALFGSWTRSVAGGDRDQPPGQPDQET